MIRPVFLAIVATILPACHVGGPGDGPPTEGSGSTPQSLGRSAAELRYFPGTSFKIVAPKACAEQCALRVGIDGPRWPVAKVTYSADGWPLGVSSDSGASFELTARFYVGGDRWVKAEALSAWGTSLGESEALIRVSVPGDDDFMASGACEETRNTRCTRWYGDGECDISLGCQCDFEDCGGGPGDDVGVGAGGRDLEVEESPAAGDAPHPPVRSSRTPYFYQYANARAPYATCQNTSIAMVLAQYGWRGRPDDITAEFGRSRAQSPAGLASVFNTLASRAGLAARLEPTVSGTLAGLRAELDAGAPVIVHGYLTSFGHVVVVTGYDRHGYYVNDPAGRWNERFRGGYPYGYDAGVGRGIHYPWAAFEAAIATSDGAAHLPLWYHAVR